MVKALHMIRKSSSHHKNQKKMTMDQCNDKLQLCDLYGLSHPSQFVDAAVRVDAYIASQELQSLNGVVNWFELEKTTWTRAEPGAEW